MTEDEAKTKWCPAARTPNGGDTCIGSGCMAWRWIGWETQAGTVAPNPPDGTKVGERRGLCGLAGVPWSMSPATC